MTLAAAAVRTERIRLSSAVTVLSSDEPVRIFQQFSTLDLLSGGHAEIMVGRGSFIESFPLFGYRLEDYDELFEQKLLLLLLLNLRASERVTWSGRHRAPLDDQAVYLRPVQDPLPVWVAVGGNPPSVMRAAALGLPMALAIIGGAPARFQPLVNLYRDAARRAHRDPAALPVSINSSGWIADDSQRAADEAWPPTELMMNRIGRERGWPPMTRRDYDAQVSPQGAYFIDSPQQVAERSCGSTSCSATSGSCCSSPSGRCRTRRSCGPSSCTARRSRRSCARSSVGAPSSSWWQTRSLLPPRHGPRWYRLLTAPRCREFLLTRGISYGGHRPFWHIHDLVVAGTRTETRQAERPEGATTTQSSAHAARRDGLLVRVHDIDHDGDDWVVTVEEAAFADVFLQVDIDTDDVEPLGSMGAMDVEAQDEPTFRECDSFGFDQSLTISDEQSAGSGSLSISDSHLQTCIEGMFRLQVSVDTGWGRPSGQVDYFDASAGADGSTAFDVELGGSLELFSVQFPSEPYERRLPPLRFAVPAGPVPIPVVITNDLKLQMEASGSLDASFSSSISGGVGFNTGMACTAADGWNDWADPSMDFTYAEPSFDGAEFDARVGPKIMVDSKLYGQVGPRFQVHPALRGQ